MDFERSSRGAQESSYRRRSREGSLDRSYNRKKDRSRSPRRPRYDGRNRDRPQRSRPSPDYHGSERDRNSSRSPAPRRRRSEIERSEHHSTHIKRSRSPSPRPSSHRSHHRSRRSSSHPSLPQSKRSTRPLPSQNEAFLTTTSDAVVRKSPSPEKQKPNYAPSGLLAAETNTVTAGSTSIVLKYHEPPEARLPPPSQPWRLYVFKSSDILETLPLHERTCWLFGREKAVADHVTEHPSCSKQHAVLQFRFVEKKGEFGDRKAGTKLYVLDLESANGTSLNGERVPEKRYVEVRSGDVLKFGDSSREYVALLPPKEETERLETRP